MANAPNLPHRVVLDASFVIGLASKEPGKFPKTAPALQQRITQVCTFHAPHLLVMEASYVLCGKLQPGTLTPAEYTVAVANLQSLLTLLVFQPSDATLIGRAEQLRQGYGCSRSADSFSIALAEQLGTFGTAELLTFDAGQQSQAASLTPMVVVTLLP